MRQMACIAVLAASPSAWAGSSAAPLQIRLTLLDRCELRTAPDARTVDTRCSINVAKTVTHVTPASPAVPSSTAATSQPLPKENTPRPDLVAIVF